MGGNLGLRRLQAQPLGDLGKLLNHPGLYGVRPFLGDGRLLQGFGDELLHRGHQRPGDPHADKQGDDGNNEALAQFLQVFQEGHGGHGGASSLAATSRRCSGGAANLSAGRFIGPDLVVITAPPVRPAGGPLRRGAPRPRGRPASPQPGKILHYFTPRSDLWQRGLGQSIRRPARAFCRVVPLDEVSARILSTPAYKI
jgi:hypothetical protein